jgi:hypothetical protein
MLGIPFATDLFSASRCAAAAAFLFCLRATYMAVDRTMVVCERRSFGPSWWTNTNWVSMLYGEYESGCQRENDDWVRKLDRNEWTVGVQVSMMKKANAPEFLPPFCAPR